MFIISRLHKDIWGTHFMVAAKICRSFFLDGEEGKTGVIPVTTARHFH